MGMLDYFLRRMGDKRVVHPDDHPMEAAAQAALVAQIAVAARKAYALISSQHRGEMFYGFALCTDDYARTIWPAANSIESLQRTAERYEAEGVGTVELNLEEFQFMQTEWEYKEGREFFDGIQPLLAARAAAAGNDTAARDRTFRALVEGLKQADKAGVFGRAAAREMITLQVVSTEPSGVLDEQMYAWEEELNA